MRFTTPWFGILFVTILLMAGLCPAVAVAGGEGMVFDLEEVSAFDLVEKSRYFGTGLRGECRDIPDANVATYPAFKSEEPIYGFVRFGAESGRADTDSVLRYSFALDESEGSGAGYDRLYLDLNRDLDLTNDGSLSKQESPPAGAMQTYSSIRQQACFQCLAVPLAAGAEGLRPLEVMPRLLITDGGYKQMSFVTTQARKGRITIADQKFDVCLGHNHTIAGWFDRPSTALHLFPVGTRGRAFSWWGGDSLRAVHKIGGAFYRFSATSSGEKLTVRPYDGPLGLFQIGAGERKITQMSMSGSLETKDMAVAVGETMQRGRPDRVSSCRLPAGDYLPTYLSVKYGRLGMSLSQNYHADGRPRGGLKRDYVYGIKIRQDQPFIFDFSNKPEVMFASPGKAHRVKRGDELKVMAVLLDPTLNIMIRGLSDSTRKQKREMNGPNGTKHTYEQDLSLDPKVVITRADGEVVAEGVMPFG